MLTCDSNTSIFSFSENAGRFVSHVAFGVNPKLRLNHLHYLFFFCRRKLFSNVSDDFQKTDWCAIRTF